MPFCISSVLQSFRLMLTVALLVNCFFCTTNSKPTDRPTVPPTNGRHTNSTTEPTDSTATRKTASTGTSMTTYRNSITTIGNSTFGTTSSTSAKDEGSSNLYWIVGGVVGACVFVVLVILVVCFCHKQHKEGGASGENGAVNEEAADANTDDNANMPSTGGHELQPNSMPCGITPVLHGDMFVAGTNARGGANPMIQPQSKLSPVATFRGGSVQLLDQKKTPFTYAPDAAGGSSSLTVPSDYLSRMMPTTPAELPATTEDGSKRQQSVTSATGDLPTDRSASEVGADQSKATQSTGIEADLKSSTGTGADQSKDSQAFSTGSKASEIK